MNRFFQFLLVFAFLGQAGIAFSQGNTKLKHKSTQSAEQTYSIATIELAVDISEVEEDDSFGAGNDFIYLNSPDSDLNRYSFFIQKPNENQSLPKPCTNRAFICVYRI